MRSGIDDFFTTRGLYVIRTSIIKRYLIVTLNRNTSTVVSINRLLFPLMCQFLFDLSRHMVQIQFHPQ